MAAAATAALAIVTIMSLILAKWPVHQTALLPTNAGLNRSISFAKYRIEINDAAKIFETTQANNELGLSDNNCFAAPNRASQP